MGAEAIFYAVAVAATAYAVSDTDLPEKTEEQKELEFEQKTEARETRQAADRNTTRGQRGTTGRAQLSYNQVGQGSLVNTKPNTLGNQTKLGGG